MAYPEEHRVDGRVPRDAASRGVTRRELLAGAAAAVGGVLCAPAAAYPASAVEELPETMETSEEFNGPYTAWAGYASTARHSIAPGAVPVKAPASSEVAWTAGVTAPAGALALRQAGQRTFLYALSGASLERYDAATGDARAAAELPAPACAGTHPVFAEASIAVVLETGQVAVFDEELAPAWVSPAPALPAGAASWGACSPVVSLGGALHVALAARDASGAVTGIELLSLAGIDGSPFWNASLPLGADAPSSPVLQLMAAGEGLLLLDGGATARLIDIATGEVADEVRCTGAIEGRAAACCAGPAGCEDADGAWVVGDASGTVSLLCASAGGLELRGASPLAAVDGSPWRLLPLAPAAARGHAYFWARRADASDAAATCLDVTLAELGAIEVGAPLGVELPAPAAPLLAVVRGVGDAVVTLYAVAAPGSLAAIERAGGSEAAWTVDELWNPSGASPSAAPLVNRDGMLFIATAPANGSEGGLLMALAPDEARSVGTPVGGSEGLDTMASVLAGIPLPNGVGVGVGALFLVATFGLYTLIRNKGGRRRSDEGVDEWRARRDAKDGDDGRGSGSAW